MHRPLTFTVLLVTASLTGCLVPENMTALREELGYASVELPDVVVKARASTVEPRVAQPVSFNAVVEGPDPETLALTWDFGDGTTLDEATVTHAWAEPGTYEVVLRAEGPELPAVTDVLAVTVRPNAAPQPLITIEDRGALVEGDTVVLSAAGSHDPDGDPLSYVWEIDGGEPVTGPRVEAAFDAGVHRVRLVAGDGLAEVVAFDSFAVALPLAGAGTVSLTDPAWSVPVTVREGAETLSVTLEHATLAGLDDVDLVLLDGAGTVVAEAATAPGPASMTASEALAVDASALAPGAYTLEARLTRGLSADVAIEGVLTYSPLLAAT